MGSSELLYMQFENGDCLASDFCAHMISLDIRA